MRITQVNVVANKEQRTQLKALLALGAIWLVGAVYDRLWIYLDHSIPAWDQTNHLTGSLNYLNALQNAQLFSGEWWRSLWMLSSKYPPLTYIATAPFQQFFGTGPDQALLVNLLFSAILLGSVYVLGKHLFNTEVGLWAAGLCVLFPRLYYFRIEYLIDYPLTALVAASFLFLTLWRDAKTKQQGWYWALAFGACLGLAMMVKQSVLFFLFLPLLWLLCRLVWQRNGKGLAQLASGLVLSIFIFGPWYSTNWIYLLSAPQNTIVGPAQSEGDPAINTLAAWMYYWNDLPSAVSWPLLLVPIVGLLLSLGRFLASLGNRAKKDGTSDDKTKRTLPHFLGRRKDSPLLSTPDLTKQHTHRTLSAFGWLALFFVGSYLIFSAYPNKDLRYIMPYLPILAIFLAYGLTLWPKRWWGVPWGAVSLAFLLMCLNLFPIGGKVGTYITQVLSPNAQHHAYLGQEWPHAKVIDEIIRTEPYLQTTVGVMPRIPDLNHNNINYFGALENFQVYGREVGVKKRRIPQDVRSLSWFITKTGDEATRREDAALAIQAIEQSPHFLPPKTWNLPDGTILKLYHRAQEPIQVQPLEQPLTEVKLEDVTVPKQAPPGMSVPVAYKWSGPWEQLKSGIVVLTWKRTSPLEQNPQSNQWLHDHGIAMGRLHSGGLRKQQSQGSFQVIEQTAMLPPADIVPGAYTLEATYLNRETGENYPIAVPPVTLTISPTASASPAPELDLVTQMRMLAGDLPEGRKALDPIFDEIARINQYDPVQDYTTQAALALQYRLQQNPENVDWAYALAFSKVLQEDAEGAAQALKRVVQLDSQNPYAHAYLAFIYLYQWRGKDAQDTLQTALKLNPNIPEIQALSGVAALLQGNVFKAWQMLQGLNF